MTQTPQSLGLDAPVFVHETAVVSPRAALARGCKIWHFCHVREGASVGEFASVGQGCYVAPTAVVGARCRIQNHVSLYDGVLLDEDVFIGPSVVFTNVLTPRAHVDRRQHYVETRVGKGVSIGANATIVCGVTIGPYALIGAGCVVHRDVPAHARLVGNPARQIGWSCWCGQRLELEEGTGEGAGSALSDTVAHRCPDCARRYVVSTRHHTCSPLATPTSLNGDSP